MHAATCGYRLLGCESGSAGLRYDFSRIKIRLRLKLICYGRSRLSCCGEPVPLEAIYRDLLDERAQPEAPSGT